MTSFSAAIVNPAQMSIEDLFHGPDIKPKDKKRLGEGYERTFALMKDSAWRTPEQIAEGARVRLDSGLRYLRYAKARGHGYEKRLVRNGLYEYRIIPKCEEILSSSSPSL